MSAAALAAIVFVIAFTIAFMVIAVRFLFGTHERGLDPDAGAQIGKSSRKKGPAMEHHPEAEPEHVRRVTAEPPMAILPSQGTGRAARTSRTMNDMQHRFITSEILSPPLALREEA